MDTKPTFISKFIEKYRSCPCLWKLKDENYANKKIREIAYNDLLFLYRQVIPTATMDTVKKKINNLRCTFRKEWKKMQASSKNSVFDSDVYIPSLWYFNLMKFLSDQEEDLNDSIAPRDEYSELHDDDDDPLEVEFSNLANLTHGEDIKLEIVPKRTMRIESPVESEPPRPPKRKMDRSMKSSSNHDELDTVGLNVAFKLRRMDEEQRNYADFLINKVIFGGLCQKLTDESDVTF